MKWLSIGENCLPDDILNRHGLKSFSSPFSSGRTNIDYVVQATRSDFSNILEPDNLTRAEVSGTKVVRSTLYTCDAELYANSVTRGFEFTHHDVISNQAHRSSFARKTQRWLDLRATHEDAAFLYHHRSGERRSLERLINKLRVFLEDFDNGWVVLFHQEIVAHEERHVTVNDLGDRLIEAKFFTARVWEGSDPNVFWARNDDDLILEMLKSAQALLPSPPTNQADSAL